MRASLLVVMTISFGMGCSSGGSGSSAATLDCAWLAGNNCWKSTLASAASCLPPRSETGTLSADMKTCTYASGPTVAFDSALVLPVPTDVTWSFTVSSGGQSCLRYQDTANGFAVTVQGQTFTQSPSGFLGVQFTCPDKTSFSNPNSFDLLSCDSDSGASFGGLPGNAWSDSDKSVAFSLIGGANGSSSQIFSCQKP